MGSIVEVEYKSPENPRVFFSRRGWCPFCDSTAGEAHGDFYGTTLGRDLNWWETVWECRACGWWQYESKSSEEADLIDEVDALHWITLKHAIVRRYDSKPHETPVRELVREVTSNPGRLYSIQPRQLEQIAQYAFSAYYQCKVLHVGKSHDGGVDLLLVDSDSPVMVQVKRRASPTAAETVATVREFIGTMYLNNAVRGIVLSTAATFSREAKLAAATVLDARKFSTFELVDYDRLVKLLNVVSAGGGEDFKPWKELLKIPGARERNGD